jgi:hypothetical protein
MELYPCRSCKVSRIPAALTVEQNIAIVKVGRKNRT